MVRRVEGAGHRMRGQRETESFERWKGRLASQSRLNAQCITGLRRRRISPSNSGEGGGLQAAACS